MLLLGLLIYKKNSIKLAWFIFYIVANIKKNLKLIIKNII